MDVLIYIALGIWGLCLGSFATALIYRIPRNIPWVYDSSKSQKGCAARSACTACGNTLSVVDLVPFFSWLFLKGRCRRCRAPISALYPLVEITTMLAFLALFWSWGFRWTAVPVLLTVPFLMAALVIDWKHMILPDSLNIILGFLGLFYVGSLYVESDWNTSLLLNHFGASVLLVFVFFFVSFFVSKIKKRPALGMGDIKFLVSAGLFLGIQALPSFMAIAGIAGLFTALLSGSDTKKGAFPFGPALIFSLYVHLFLTGLGFDYTW